MKCHRHGADPQRFRRTVRDAAHRDLDRLHLVAFGVRDRRQRRDKRARCLSANDRFRIVQTAVHRIQIERGRAPGQERAEGRGRQSPGLDRPGRGFQHPVPAERGRARVVRRGGDVRACRRRQGAHRVRIGTEVAAINQDVAGRRKSTADRGEVRGMLDRDRTRIDRGGAERERPRIAVAQYVDGVRTAPADQGLGKHAHAVLIRLDDQDVRALRHGIQQRLIAVHGRIDHVERSRRRLPQGCQEGVHVEAPAVRVGGIGPIQPGLAVEGRDGHVERPVDRAGQRRGRHDRPGLVRRRAVLADRDAQAFGIGLGRGVRERAENRLRLRQRAQSVRVEFVPCLGDMQGRQREGDGAVARLAREQAAHGQADRVGLDGVHGFHPRRQRGRVQEDAGFEGLEPQRGFEGGLRGGELRVGLFHRIGLSAGRRDGAAEKRNGRTGPGVG